jgi:LPXTG-motif cell wall-anchored protein
MQYVKVPKKELVAVLRHHALSGTKAPNFWDVSQWPKWWNSGAADLEKSDIGKIVTAPVRLPAAVFSATKKTVDEVPGLAKTAVTALPIIGIAAALLGAGYLVYKFKKNKRETPQTF